MLGTHSLQDPLWCHMDFLVTNQPSRRVAAVHHIGPYPGIGQAFARLDAAIRTAGFGGTEALLIAVYHDDPNTTPASALRSDAGIIIEQGRSLPAGLTELTVPEGKYLWGRHRGSYAELPEAWLQLRTTGLGQTGVQRRPGASYELYPNTPDTAATEDLITDIYIPVK